MKTFILLMILPPILSQHAKWWASPLRTGLQNSPEPAELALAIGYGGGPAKSDMKICGDLVGSKKGMGGVGRGKAFLTMTQDEEIAMFKSHAMGLQNEG